MALSACNAGTTYTAGLPLGYSGLPLGYSGLPLGYSGLPLASVNNVALPHTPITYAAHAAVPAPITYATHAAPALVQPVPYSVQTGVKAEVSVKPVEQHGYVVKY